MNTRKRSLEGSNLCSRQTSDQLEALFERAIKTNEERAFVAHACPFSSDPGGLLRKALNELRDAMVIRTIVSEWVENEGLHFLNNMERRLGVLNLMTTAKQIIKMDPVVRV